MKRVSGIRVPRVTGIPAWRAALRIARRDALRAKARSALVVVMIALPVLAVTVADVTYHSAGPTRAQEVTRELGAADAQFSDAGYGPGPVVQMPDASRVGTPRGSADETENDGAAGRPVDVAAVLATLLPKGTRTVTSEDVDGLVRTAHGLRRVTVREMPAADALLRGKVDVRRGLLPDEPHELAATTAFLESSGLHVGSHTRIKGLAREFRITAAVELPGDLNGEYLIARPHAVIEPWRAQAERDKRAAPPHPMPKEYYVAAKGGGVTWQDVRAANEHGVLVRSRAVLRDPPPDAAVPAARTPGVGIGPGSATDTGMGSRRATVALATVAAMAVLEIVLLAGPAFAVGARRARRQLGLIGICGADRGQLRAVVLAGGVVLGTAGAVLGVLLGLGLSVLCRPVFEEWDGQRFGPVTAVPSHLLTIVGLGVLTGVLAALVPALVAGRQSVLQSLAGRRGVRHGSRVLPALGLAAILLGGGLALVGGATGSGWAVVAVGSVVAELGMLACVPVLVGACARFGSRLPLAARFALRDAARNRGRTAPAVAAVTAAVAGTVAVATYTVSLVAEDRFGYEPLLRPGTVALLVDSYANEGGHPEKALPALRRAMEHALPVTGERADVDRVWAGADCYTRAAGDDCGEIELVRPDTHRCPLEGPTGRDLAERLSADEHRRLRRGPECVDAGGFSPIGDAGEKVLVGDARLLRTYVGLRDPAAERALAEGKPVLLNSAYAQDGRVQLKITPTGEPLTTAGTPGTPGTTGPHSAPGTAGPGDRGTGSGRTTGHRGPVAPTRPTPPDPSRKVFLDAYVAPEAYAATPGVRLILPAVLAQRLNLHTAPAGSFYAVRHTPDKAEEERANAVLDRGDAATSLYIERGPQTDADDFFLMVLAVFAGVVTIGAAVVTTGLAKADAEADLTTLSAVGAPPGVRRGFAGFQCAGVAGLGVLLGSVAGVVPAVALRLVDGRDALAAMRRDPLVPAHTPIELPWSTLTVLAVGVPVLAGLLAACSTRSRTALPRRAG
ncbi:FtsX-like permease family protein [Streptomyces syringium]|uniref:FtsX-like permease family protein n=1 Tax=Streptomyces syringium TaxID=76729 RepID=UPI00368DDD95